MSGMYISAPKRAFPVTLSMPSGRSGRVPTILNCRGDLVVTPSCGISALLIWRARRRVLFAHGNATRRISARSCPDIIPQRRNFASGPIQKRTGPIHDLRCGACRRRRPLPLHQQMATSYAYHKFGEMQAPRARDRSPAAANASQLHRVSLTLASFPHAHLIGPSPPVQLRHGRERHEAWRLVLATVLGLTIMPSSASATDVGQLISLARVPGLSMAVLRNGVASLTTAGVRNARDGAPIDQETIFDAASLSKPVFAYAVLQLIDAGALALDMP